MKHLSILAAGMGLILFATGGCGHHGSGHGEHADHDDHGGHDDGEESGDHSDAGEGESHDDGEEGGHGHAEEALGTFKIGGLDVECAQGHGAVAAGKEGHLVVKLPYSDDGSTIVRAWIGSEDRSLSLVGKGTYAASHDDYDIHASAPSPLPAAPMWWIEIEKPDGTKLVGSAKPIL